MTNQQILQKIFFIRLQENKLNAKILVKLHYQEVKVFKIKKTSNLTGKILILNNKTNFCLLKKCIQAMHKLKKEQLF